MPVEPGMNFFKNRQLAFSKQCNVYCRTSIIRLVQGNIGRLQHIGGVLAATGSQQRISLAVHKCLRGFYTGSTLCGCAGIINDLALAAFGIKQQKIWGTPKGRAYRRVHVFCFNWNCY